MVRNLKRLEYSVEMKSKGYECILILHEDSDFFVQLQWQKVSKQIFLNNFNVEANSKTISFVSKKECEQNQ